MDGGKRRIIKEIRSSHFYGKREGVHSLQQPHLACRRLWSSVHAGDTEGGAILATCSRHILHVDDYGLVYMRAIRKGGMISSSCSSHNPHRYNLYMMGDEGLNH